MGRVDEPWHAILLCLIAALRVLGQRLLRQVSVVVQLCEPSRTLQPSKNGLVVIPVVWSVVTAGLLSSLFLMTTKASALCGALSSTPCCGCCSGAFLSCTEVFALG